MKSKPRTLIRTGALLVLLNGCCLRANLPSTAEKITVNESFPNLSNWDYRASAPVYIPGSTGVFSDNVASAIEATTDGTKTVLKITGKKELSNGLPFTCGGAISKTPYGYGYYEISAKIPQEKGWHASFWLGGANEIDSPEINTGPSSPSAPVKATFNTHYWPSVTAPAKVNHIAWGLDFVPGPPTDTARTESINIDTSSGYHRFGFEWTPSSAAFYFDGTLKAKTRYPGPHFATPKASITLSAANTNGDGIDAPASMYVEYFKCYQRTYNFPDWSTGSYNAALPVGDSTFSASKNALDPDQLAYTSGTPRVIASNDFSGQAHWNFPATSTSAIGRYEVFIWNPSTFPASVYSPDISDAPEDAQANPGGLMVDYTVGGTTTTIDSVYAGQSWVDLGPSAFSGATTNAITFGLSTGAGLIKPLWSLRAGPAIFRPLDVFDDFSSSSLSSWTTVEGSWSAPSGSAVNSGTGKAVLERTGPDATRTDGMVRATVTVPGSGGATSAGVVARYTSGGYYLLRIDYPNKKLGILRYESSTAAFTSIADTPIPSDIPLTGAVPLAFMLKNSGSDVSMIGFAGGRPVVAVTDSAPGTTYTGSGQPGIRAFGGTANFDDFGVGP